jgi:hypothetical protein
MGVVRLLTAISFRAACRRLKRNIIKPIVVVVRRQALSTRQNPITGAGRGGRPRRSQPDGGGGFLPTRVIPRCGLGVRSICRIDKHGNTHGLGRQLMQECQPLRLHLLDEKIDAGRVAARPREAGDKTKLDRVFADAEYDRDRGAHCAHCASIVSQLVGRFLTTSYHQLDGLPPLRRAFVRGPRQSIAPSLDQIDVAAILFGNPLARRSWPLCPGPIISRRRRG